MAHYFAANGGIDHHRCLEKSLRLPRTYPKVAEWLFSESHLPYHRQAPLLSATAFAASRSIKLRYVFFNVNSSGFDIFGINDGPSEAQPSALLSADPQTLQLNQGDTFGSSTAQNNLPPDSNKKSTNTITNAELLLTPVTRVTPSIIVGYAMLMGSIFEPDRSRAQPGSFKGKAHFNGRYAYDFDNNHLIVVVNAVTEHHTVIVDLTFAGISRERFYYSVPYRNYSHADLPSRVISHFSSVEVRAPPTSEQPPTSTSWKASDFNKSSDSSQPHGNTVDQSMQLSPQGGSPSWPSQHPPPTRVTTSDEVARRLGDEAFFADLGGMGSQSLKTIHSLARDMRSLVHALAGHFKAPMFTRDVFDINDPTFQVSHIQGSIAGSMGPPERQLHRHALIYGWQEYSASACALQTERILNGGLMGAIDTNGSGTGNLVGGGRLVEGSSERENNWMCQAGREATDVGGARANGNENGGTSSSTGEQMTTNGLLGGEELAEEMDEDDERVRDKRTCQTCKGLIGRKGVALVDEETMRREKLEAKKRKNRQSAARSNQRRKEREEQQRVELSERQDMVRRLTARHEALRAENFMLRNRAAERGLLFRGSAITP